MPNIDLTQAEADALLQAEKRRVDEKQWEFPLSGQQIHIPLVATDTRERFLLDLSRGKISLKVVYQLRARQVVVLARLDLAGRPHRNPDGQDIQAPHLHLYREGFGDKWAFPAPTDAFPRLPDLQETLTAFMRYCHVVAFPHITIALF